MKIIDLLNKIAKGEEVPKYIRYRDISKHEYNIMMVCKENIIFQMDQCVLDLNDEVEIMEEKKEIEQFIEEEKEIEKLRINNGKVNGTWENGNKYCYTLSAPQTVIINKINELIEAVNEIKRG
jgi:hypothetical protein